MLPVHFCAHALKLDAEVFTLVDEVGRAWNCDLKQDPTDVNQYRLGLGWDSFSRVRGLLVGAVVMLGVTEMLSDVIYYIPA